MHATSGLRSRTRGALRLAGALLGRPIVGPRLAGLEVTHFCNLKCGFCESHGRFMPAPVVKTREYVGGRRSMDLATIERVARSLARLGTEWVELSGKGDPIVHPELPAIVRVIKAAGLRCSMFTNGAVPRPDLAATLVETGLDRLNISLNAATREVYERVVGKDLWDKALEFLDDVLERKRRAGSERPWVRLTYVMCKDNLEDMDRSVDFCIERKVNEGGWCIMGELPQTTSIQLSRGEADALLVGLPGWMRRLEAAGITHDLRSFEEDLRLRIGTGPRQENPLQRTLPCYEGWMHTVIAPDGTVAPCCYCEGTKLGNVVDEDFADIWNGERYADFRRRSLAMPRTQEPICRECYTSCNRALENQRMHERLGPLRIFQISGAPAEAKPARAPAAARGTATPGGASTV